MICCREFDVNGHSALLELGDHVARVTRVQSRARHSRDELPLRSAVQHLREVKGAHLPIVVKVLDTCLIRRLFPFSGRIVGLQTRTKIWVCVGEESRKLLSSFLGSLSERSVAEIPNFKIRGF